MRRGSRPASAITAGAGDDEPDLADVVDVLIALAGAAAMSFPPWMVASGMTSSTEEFADSRCSSPADTVAAKALTRLYDLTWVACTCASSFMNGPCAVWIAPVRVVAAALPTRCCASWPFMITMTCLSTCWDSVAANAGVIGPNSASGATLAGAAVTAAACPATSADAPATAVTTNRLLPCLFSLRPGLGTCI
jgi:hypothetical protein